MADVLDEIDNEAPGVGHNSLGKTLQKTAQDQLRVFVERIERLEKEKSALTTDIREVYAEAESTGFYVKALRALIKLRNQEEERRREDRLILETYLHALGMME